MASTSLTLGPHWETFIQAEIASGRYASASEVVRDALRVLETRQAKLAALRAHLAEGAAQAARDDYVDNFSMDELLRGLDDPSNSIPNNTSRQG